MINPISGINRNPRKIVAWIEENFRHSAIGYEISYTGRPGDGTSLARAAVEAGFDIVAVVGGDGTINEVGRALINTDVAMAVIPSGSGNGFARNVRIPLNQLEAIRLLLSPRIVAIDAGKLNQHYFFNVAGFGLDANISQNFEEFGIRGPLPYFLVGTKVFLTYQPERVKIILDDKELVLFPLVVTIANAAEYGNGAIIAPHALPDDGFLDVTVVDHMPIWKIVPKLYHLFNGTIDQVPGFHTYRVTSAIIERNQRGTIQTDGNPHEADAILKVEVIPHSLKVVVGPEYSSPTIGVVYPAS